VLFYVEMTNVISTYQPPVHFNLHMKELQAIILYETGGWHGQITVQNESS